MVFVFQHIISMSLTGSVLFCLIFMTYPLTRKLLASHWHCRFLCVILAFFLLPVGAPATVLIGKIPGLLLLGNIVDFPVYFQEIPAPDMQTVYTQIQGQPTLQAIIPMVLSFIWLMGMTTYLLIKLFQFVHFQKLFAKTSKPIDDSILLITFETLKQKMQISHNINLFTNPCVSTPMLIGIFNTRMILPDTALNDQELELIFSHELTHYRHRDLWIKAISVISCAVHWFNPCAYLLTKQLDVFLEQSCDASVIKDMGYEQRRFYSSMILEMLDRGATQRSGVYAGLCSNSHAMKNRLSAIMNKKETSKRAVMLAVIVLAAICIGGLNVSAAMYHNETPKQFIPAPLETKAEINSFLWPTEGGMVLNALDVYPGHTGIDILVPAGTPVYASVAGTVVVVEESDEGYGKYIVIDHGNGYQTIYAHNSQIDVLVGDFVDQSQTIAAVGDTGSTTGANLHFEIRKNGVVMNPEDFVNTENNPMELPKG